MNEVDINNINGAGNASAQNLLFTNQPLKVGEILTITAQVVGIANVQMSESFQQFNQTITASSTFTIVITDRGTGGPDQLVNILFELLGFVAPNSSLLIDITNCLS